MAELKIISMDEVQSKEVNWLWYPYIPYGKITIIQGDPGEGKTTLALRLAALLSKGEALPYDNTEREPVKIIYALSSPAAFRMPTPTPAAVRYLPMPKPAILCCSAPPCSSVNGSPWSNT